jgi:predicted RNA-binding protein YlxR (DUF448 family)
MAVARTSSPRTAPHSAQPRVVNGWNGNRVTVMSSRRNGRSSWVDPVAGTYSSAQLNRRVDRSLCDRLTACAGPGQHLVLRLLAQTLPLGQIAMNRSDCYRSFADCTGNPLDGAVANIARCKDSRAAALEGVRLPLQRPGRAGVRPDRSARSRP